MALLLMLWMALAMTMTHAFVVYSPTVPRSNKNRRHYYCSRSPLEWMKEQQHEGEESSEGGAAGMCRSPSSCCKNQTADDSVLVMSSPPPLKNGATLKNGAVPLKNGATLKNGAALKNGATVPLKNGASVLKNGVALGKKKQQQNHQLPLAPTAPEVNDWTDIMSKGAVWDAKKKNRRKKKRRRKKHDKAVVVMDGVDNNKAVNGSKDMRSYNGSEEQDLLLSVLKDDGTDDDDHEEEEEDEDAYDFDFEDDGNAEQWHQALKDMSAHDLEQVEQYWDQLLPKVSYLGTEHVAQVYNALRVAYCAHNGQARKSGEPFIIHPVQVALLLAGLKMDAETIMAGLLHDTVEDTELTFGQLQCMFGPVVRSIVEGETKVSKMPKLALDDKVDDEQAENLRQMFVAMTDDYRIIVVKLADRLHNMRTLQHMKPAKQIKISRETLDIFAPLAHRMGIWQFKSELEYIAFYYLYPREYATLSKRLKIHKEKYQDTLATSQRMLEHVLRHDATLQEQASNVQVYGRTKELYSLWHKMQTKNEHNLDRIVDVVALRVIITPRHQQKQNAGAADRGVWLCYHVLGLVQHLPGFSPVPTRVKDYISFPKPNGYQSLHTALMWKGQTMEVQIRTNWMHHVAEYGMASHWAYKQQLQQQQHDSLRRDNNNSMYYYSTPWLSSIKEWQKDDDNPMSAREFVDSVRRELLGKRVFCFLRNGKILNLARGATAIDAAFAIHSEVGLHMHGVEINGSPQSFSYVLQNGDVVSILTGEGQPTTDWMQHAKSRSTRSKLRAYFRMQQKQRLRHAGEILLMDYLWMHGPLIEKHSEILNNNNIIPQTIAQVAQYLSEYHSRHKNDNESNNDNYNNSDVVDKNKKATKLGYENMDELLLELGGSSTNSTNKKRASKDERSLLHHVASKLFECPEQILIQAEQDKTRSIVSQSVVAVIDHNRKQARVAAQAACAELPKESPAEPPQCANATTVELAMMKPPPPSPPAEPVPTTIGYDDRPWSQPAILKKKEESAWKQHNKHDDDMELLYSSSPPPRKRNDSPEESSSLEDLAVEEYTYYADPEHLCERCLPIYGDDIIGTMLVTRRRRKRKNDDSEVVWTTQTPTVHRVGCPLAQRAVNQQQKPPSTLPFIVIPPQEATDNGPFQKRIDSVSLRRQTMRRWPSPVWAKSPAMAFSDSGNNKNKIQLPVPLTWPEEEEDEFMALTEIVIYAQDRKMLLADCSESVSQLSQIVMTGSSSSQEHAILMYLVRVPHVRHLQVMMDELRKIRSVLSVERRFGSQLMKR